MINIQEYHDQHGQDQKDPRAAGCSNESGILDAVNNNNECAYLKRHCNGLRIIQEPYAARVFNVLVSLRRLLHQFIFEHDENLVVLRPHIAAILAQVFREALGM